MKTDNANRLTNPKNLNQVSRQLAGTKNDTGYIKIDKIKMATLASFLVAHEKYNVNRLTDLENLYARFQAI